MGIVIRQSFKNTLSTYIGFGIGAINTLFLYTNFLTDEYYGLVAFILSAANIMLPFMAFGVQNALIKFYSTFKTKNTLNSFLTLMLLLPLVFIIPTTIFGLIGYDFIASLLSEKNPLVYGYLWHILITAIAMAYFEVFFSWSKVQMKTVFGNVMREIFHRFCIMILLGCVYMGWISVNTFIGAVVAVYVARMFIMKIYAFTLRFPVIKFNKIENVSSILKYSFLIIIAGSIAMVILDLDKFMIGQYLEIENVAYYSVAIFIATVISVPQRSMHQILMPITAKFLNDGNKEELKSLYQKSSLSLLVISGLIFLLIVLNINMLYQILPEKFTGGLFVVIIIGIAKVYDNAMGNNNAILFNSDYYRIVLFFGVLLALLAIVFNVILIPLYGIEGSAMATFLAIVIYNTLKLIFVRIKLNIQPFSLASFKVLVLVAVLGLALYWVDFPLNPIVGIVLKSILVSLLYCFTVYKLDISEDINGIIKKYIPFL
ncbi:lipopolysaccharide biosynthesis protein [Winogradskyella jejuensis]|uniref:Membrane protein involved in the export of O-antigen and teichoic acid n=1 Tax=Winogradskyella jejuensis TaxID=1089305 RepID=A0A1M5UH44_9FLAO|nr:polysaccharide biosynthesis C-terminal domain-containing protein [Winogradskyella jejuensis]SHH62334.1 Membrane protein involved in the export of O-antigen and teichoic acid [Winogradskyella jejuensis]